MLDAFSPSGVWVNTLSDLLQAEIVGPTCSDKADKFACWPARRGSSKDLISALLDVHFDEALFAFAKSTVTARERFREGVVLNLLLIKLPRIHTDMSNLWISVSGPWQFKASATDTAKE